VSDTRARPPAADTRSRLLAAAAVEFAARGFAATTVERIARRARVNKAMIYYHFPSKRALYTAIVRDHFGPIVDQLNAIRAGTASPVEQLNRLIEAFVAIVDSSKPFLRLFLREIADGGVHLGVEELAMLAGVFGIVRGVIAEGIEQRVFRPVHPALAHFTIIAPVIMFRATAPVRDRLKSVRRVEIPEADHQTIVGHVQTVASRMLAP
jgi:TetR/AcrR family transcriptional regulator